MTKAAIEGRLVFGLLSQKLRVHHHHSKKVRQETGMVTGAASWGLISKATERKQRKYAENDARV